MSTTVLLAPPNSPSGSGGGGYSNTLSGSWVQDSAGNVYWLETATDEQGVVSYIYYDQPGGNIVTPTGDVSPVLDSNMQLVKRGDDINGDGSVVVTFYRLNIYDESGAIISSIPQSPDGTTYTVQGVEIDPQDEIEELLKTGNNINAAILTQGASLVTSNNSISSSSFDLNARTAGSFINFEFDECDLTYVTTGAATGEIETAVYSLASVVVGTVTLSYDALTGDLTNVARA
jgi:hypothetical protein